MATPANARIDVSDNPLRTYIQARVAAMNGDHAGAAELFASLTGTGADRVELRRSALSEALGAGRYDLALRMARSVPPASLPSDARLLLAAAEIKARRYDRAQSFLDVRGDTGNLAFLMPLLTSWNFSERGDWARAMATLNAVPANDLLGPFIDEQKAFVLIKAKRTGEAEAFARRAVGTAGPRETRVRLILADGFLAAGDRQRAAIMLDGLGADGHVPRQQLLAGKQLRIRVDNAAKATSDVIATLAADVARRQRAMPPIGLVQVARYLDPENSSATALLAILFQSRERSNEALAVLGTVSPDDPLSSPIRDLETQILTEAKRNDAAYRIAAAAAAKRDAGSADFARLGSVQVAMKQFDAAAASFERAIALARAEGVRAELWSLYLLRADALEEAGRWPQVKEALGAALSLEPDQPLLLNFLGYAKLERGEDIAAAEAMIRKAAELAPDDASIIDSLGWAQFKQGKVEDAIVTLQDAATKDPTQAEIHEHLGDALYTSGRRMEARYAWEAALISAEDDVARRIRAKLQTGLTKANAAP